MKLRASGKITSTSKKNSPRIYAEIRISKRKYPRFPHKKKNGLPISLLIGPVRHQTVIREVHKLGFYWISQKEGLWELLEKSGYSLNETVSLGVDTYTEPIEISIISENKKANLTKRFHVSDYFPEEKEDDTVSLSEGAVKRVSVNAYERNSAARNECLREYGYQCIACGFDFEKTYGEAGGTFIHVHHLTPLSEIRETYVVDGKRDLRPVCPNCHAIIHRYSPYLTIEELRTIIQEQKSNLDR